MSSADVDICLLISLYIKQRPETFNIVLRTPMARRSLLSTAAHEAFFQGAKICHLVNQLLPHNPQRPYF